MLKSRTQTTTLHKIIAHTSIYGNEQTNTLAKLGHRKYHINAITPYEHETSTYYLQKKLVVLYGKNSKQRPNYRLEIHTNSKNGL